AGILTLHAGLIIMILGEFVTGLFAQESNMTIYRNQTVNYSEDLRTCELAVIDPSPADHDLVTVIPQSRLEHAGTSIHDVQLPFDVRVDEWMANSQIYGPQQPKPEGVQAKATAGTFARVAVAQIPQATGVGGGEIDLP